MRPLDAVCLDTTCERALISNLTLNLTGPPASCKDLQLNAGLQVDGEQTLTFQGKELQVSHRAQIPMLCWKSQTWSGKNRVIKKSDFQMSKEEQKAKGKSNTNASKGKMLQRIRKSSQVNCPERSRRAHEELTKSLRVNWPKWSRRAHEDLTSKLPEAPGNPCDDQAN